MKKLQIKATSLRTLMLVLIIIIVAVIGGGFYYAQTWLRDFASTPADASKSSTSAVGSSDVTQLKNEIASQKVAAEKAINITASTTDFKSKIQQDLNKYASSTGVVISNYDALQASDVKISSLPIIGVTSNFVEVKLENPVPYTNLIKFIKAIETNLPKMKITSLNITRADSPNTSVTVGPITIEVYTK